MHTSHDDFKFQDLHVLLMSQNLCVTPIVNYWRYFSSQSIILYSDGYAQSDLELEMIGGEQKYAISGIEKLQLPQFEVHKHQFMYRLQNFSTGSYPRLSLQFLLKAWLWTIYNIFELIRYNKRAKNRNYVQRQHEA